MHFFVDINPLYSLSGFVVGALVGLTGVGGGSLMTPLLILLFGIHPAAAVGTDLLYASATKTAGTLIHGLGRTIHWRMVGLLAIGSVPATALTILGLAHFGIEGATTQTLITKVLAVALFLTSLALIFRPAIRGYFLRHAGEISAERTWKLTILTGAILGVLVSITSVGAGALGVTALIILYPHLPTARIVGSDIAHAVPLTLMAGLGHWWLGSIDVSLLVSLLIGSVPGIVLGSFLAPRLPDHYLRYILAATLLLVAARLLF